MKLLNSFVSPFAARVRLAIYAYDLPVEIAPSGQWTPDFQKSPDYLAINPIGRVPTLILDDGSALPESRVIVEYLADAFPDTALRGGDAQQIAVARLLAHLAELYVQSPAGPLFGQIFSPERDAETIDRAVAAIDTGLSYVEHFMPRDFARDDAAITVADCALVPVLFFFVERMVAALGATPIIGNHPKVADYWTRMQARPVVIKLIDEMRSAIAASRLSPLVTDAA